MASAAPVQVNLVAGFLGAGKTSAIRHLLRALPAGERVAVVVNDFGDARIDPALLADGRGLVSEIGGSCICCTAPAGFVAAVADLLGKVDRILVEPTGLARPADLVDTLRRAPYAGSLALGPLVVLVDPHLLATGEIPADALDQARLADVLVANRVDLAAAEELDAFRTWVKALWPGPLEVHETTHGELPLSVLRWPEQHRGPWTGGPRILARAEPGQVHPYVHRSWGWPPEVVFDRRKLLDALGGPLVRAKGILRTDEGTLELQRAGGQLHEAPSGWRRDSRLDVIVRDDQEALLVEVGAALEAARLDPETLRSRGTAIEIGERTFDRTALQALPGGVPDVSALVPGRKGAAARLAELLRVAGVADDAAVVVVARDGLTTPPTPASALADAVLVHSLGDEPLPESQGGPFRLLIPGGTDACANVKGVVRLAVR